MDKKILETLEKMAKLQLNDDERDRALRAFAIMEQSFARLAEIETAGVPPLVSVLELKNVLREDTAVKTVPREVLLAGAPDSQDGYFKVPRTIE